MYFIQVVWNRDFDWVELSLPAFHDLDKAIQYAESDALHGDGARIKKHRIVDAEGNVVYQYGKKISP